MVTGGLTNGQTHIVIIIYADPKVVQYQRDDNSRTTAFNRTAAAGDWTQRLVRILKC